MHEQRSALRAQLEQKDLAGVAHTLGFSTPFQPLPEGPLVAVRRVQGFAHSRSTRLLVVHGMVDPRARQRLVKSMQVHAPLDSTLWWFVGVEHRFSIATTDASGRHRVRSLVVGPDMCPAALQQLERLAVGGPRRDGQPITESTHVHWSRVMDAEPLTREFFKRFSSLLGLMVREVQNGPREPQQCHDVALINLLRLVFIYFLQRRGAMDSNREFVLQQWLDHCTQSQESFYRSTLKPLFFGLLNTALAERGTTKDFGDVPFLNGGLFERTPIEREYHQLDWTDEVWKTAIEDVFERYPFALSGSDAHESVRAIDPEMLGKVFEGLMYGERRANSGSFYTPRDVVHDLVHGAVVRQLASKAGMDEDRLRALVEASAPVLAVEERSRLRRSLSDFRVLDPACGTGAFLLAAAQLLARVWSLVEGRQVDHVLLREVIHKHIFGVDIEHTAVRLCELRLWLEILAATPEMGVAQLPPLPNLGHRILAGNSLIDPFDFAQPGDPAFDSDWVRQISRQIETLQASWLLAHGESKRKLYREVEEARHRMQLQMVEAQLDHLFWQETDLTKASMSRDLFGSNASNLERHMGDLTALEDEKKRLQNLRLELEVDRTSGVAFSYASAFPDVRGFDVVVTNPPWVRSHRLDPQTRKLLNRRYKSTSSTLWAGAASRGIKAPFGVQVDLANIFMERSLELVRPSGRVAALVPAKMFRSLQGTAVRRVLSRARVVGLEDFSQASRSLFDATTYPAAIELVREAPSQAFSQLKLWEGTECQTFDMPSQSFATSAPWPMMDPDVAAIFAKMEQAHGGRGLDPQRGVFTGRNAVFIRTRAVWESIMGPCELIRPVLTGRDPLGKDKCVLWAYTERGRPIWEIDPRLKSYFEAHRRELESRSDHRADQPLWQVFRVRAQMTGPKVVWRDMSEFLEAYVVPGGGVPLNTLYYLPCETVEQAEVIQAVLTSVPVRAFARAFGERARGGWRRHFAWLLRMMPVPAEFWAWIGASRIPTDREISQAYGLSSKDVERLAHWMGTSGPAQLRSA